MYKLLNKVIPVGSDAVQRLTDNACIPFAPANTDYQQFKIQVANGTPLEDTEGNVMTQEQVNEFLKTIP
jgi:hypothetical protein